VDNKDAVTSARRVLARERSAEAAARVLVERAVNLKSTDNVSVLLVCLHDRSITLPKTNSMLFRRLREDGGGGSRCGTPSGTNTPVGAATPAGGTPRGDRLGAPGGSSRGTPTPQQPPQQPPPTQQQQQQQPTGMPPLAPVASAAQQPPPNLGALALD
jgi:hypothetical protein